MKTSHLVIDALLLAVLSGCATNPVTGKTDLILVSGQQEVEIGKQIKFFEIAASDTLGTTIEIQRSEPGRNVTVFEEDPGTTFSGAVSWQF